jgi:peptidoglycan/xylan/chitin deacetylase (PgdA/CDA1 family)
MTRLAQRLVRVSVSRLSTAGSIFCFHSIAGPELPSAGSTHVPLETLKASVRAARRTGEIVPLAELATRHRAGRATAGLVALTFDDAYASLLGETGDFLEREAVPATVFVTTQAAERGARFWWDRVEDAQAAVSLARWREFEDACGLPPEYREGQPPEFGPIRPLRQWVLAEHRGRWPEHLEGALSALERDAGGTTAHRSMTFDEIASLRARAGLEVGVHTVTHPVLPLLSDDEMREEIEGCTRALRDRLGSIQPILAVPFGLLDERTVGIAREAGMTASLGLSGTTLASADPEDELPRFCVMREEPAWKLYLRLGGAVERIRRWRGTEEPRYPPLPSPIT